MTRRRGLHDASTPIWLALVMLALGLLVSGSAKSALVDPSSYVFDHRQFLETRGERLNELENSFLNLDSLIHEKRIPDMEYDLRRLDRALAEASAFYSQLPDTPNFDWKSAVGELDRLIASAEKQRDAVAAKIHFSPQ